MNIPRMHADVWTTLEKWPACPSANLNPQRIFPSLYTIIVSIHHIYHILYIRIYRTYTDICMYTYIA